MIILHSVENDVHVLGTLYDLLLFGHRGTPVSYYRILSYPVSSKYHQAVVNINPCQTDTRNQRNTAFRNGLVVQSYNSLIVSAEMRPFMGKPSSSTVFVC